jgi:hypothetical protein
MNFPNIRKSCSSSQSLKCPSLLNLLKLLFRKISSSSDFSNFIVFLAFQNNLLLRCEYSIRQVESKRTFLPNIYLISKIIWNVVHKSCVNRLLAFIFELLFIDCNKFLFWRSFIVGRISYFFRSHLLVIS